MMQHLLADADRFGLDRLKLLCEAKLCEELSTDTVATTLSMAEQHHCAQLKEVNKLWVFRLMLFSGVVFFDVWIAGQEQHLQTSLRRLVMKSEGFKHLEQSCPSLLSGLLETVALADKKPNLISGKKRSSSSIFALDLAAADGVAESVNPNGRRMRRRG
ncbi:hypothetical protein SASPL_104844 [Salvia splendens]|uniref:BPM/SPOP BACK domain-containing protein n=1 Tax=Salvia splendens TaxID=180675 RepID=A0A8X8YIS6_SALSN|nr:hypothetical protein SASPL_104844 [Salvia splendens]